MTPRMARLVCTTLPLLLGAAFGMHVAAQPQQEKELPSTPGQPYTLHVYEHLIQLPSFVLNPLHGPYTGLQSKDFSMRLDSGPVFHPLHVRLQGDDEMSLDLLLDNAGQIGVNLQQELDAYASQLPPEPFHPRDKLSITTAVCSRVTSLHLAKATMGTLRSGVATLMTHPNAVGPNCDARMPLWDVVGTVASRMHDAPGRRVLLVISDGIDLNSSNNWERVREYATHYGIAIMGVRLNQIDPTAVLQKGSTGIDAQEDPFSMLCSGTGGILLDADLDVVWLQVLRLVHLLRERYILEFQRPAKDSAGLHIIDLTVKDKKALVRVSGIGVPLRDANQLSDPSTVPSDTSQAPVIGDRRVLPKPE